MEDNKIKGARRTVFKLVAIAIVAFLAGYFFKSLSQQPSPTTEHKVTNQQATAEGTIWTCSMHPQIRQPKPGKCPICFMDLIPIVVGSVSDEGLRRLEVSEEARKLMEIETSTVQRKFVTVDVRMVGKIDFDETRVKNITARVAGRIDRLYVDFTGITVNKGDHLVELYSPELISAQAELLQSLKAASGIGNESSDLVKKTASDTLQATREKLRLLGLTDEQITQIENSGQTHTHITIYSPMSGIVIQKNATEGMYVQTGMPIYTVADLSKVWVKLDAYESDLVWVRYGQEAEITTEAYPGEIFKGKITFIDPILSEKTRTVKLRVNVDNTPGKLKPQMFVRAIVRSMVAAGGKVMAPEMAGKWICPMHPDIVKEAGGSCDICGMDLVTTESLGYVKADTPKPAALVIPTSAALITGKRAVVYVQLPKTEKPTYEGREITLGPRAGDYYIVESGLAEGELVVTKGNFKIDSALQIQAKPSMMNPQGEKAQSETSEHRH